MKLDYSPILVLLAPNGESFKGRDIWDVMLCLGLRWGDMDVFHWENRGGMGDDFFFSAWTSTPPGYFFPEEIAAGNVRVEDLVFGFSCPRCSRPAEVFESMVRAIQYTQKRLGGTIVQQAVQRLPGHCELTGVIGVVRVLLEAVALAGIEDHR